VSGIQNSEPAVQDIGEVDFQTFISQPGRLNVVDFHADWCGPCKQLAPVLSGVIEANATVARLGKLNMDQARELAQEQGVRSIPDVRFYVEGKLVHKFTGTQSKEAIADLIANHSANLDPPLRPEGMAESDGTPGSAPPRPRPPNAKPIEEAMKPMEKDWLPPGMKRKE
jgi:thioredoxin